MSNARAFSLSAFTAACAVTFALMLAVGSMATPDAATAWMAQGPAHALNG